MIEKSWKSWKLLCMVTLRHSDQIDTFRFGKNEMRGSSFRPHDAVVPVLNG